MSSKPHFLHVLGFLLVAAGLAGNLTQVHAANGKKPANSIKERLVLMPLRVSEENRNMQGAMETALVQGLQQKYEVFSGDQVAQKAKEIFNKESHTAKKDCDATRCMQGIAEAFQAELIATANVTRIEGGYLLALSIQNIFDNNVVYSNSLPCKDCDPFQVVDKLKELSGALVKTATAPAAPVAPPQASKGSNSEDKESLYWSSIKDSQNPDEFDVYLQAYPNGMFAPLAKSRSAALNKAAAKAAMPFKDNGNGTVTDLKTGLIWQKEDGGKKSWDDSMSYCRGLSLAGHSDWHLPSEDELTSLSNNAVSKVEIREAYFPSMESWDDWWSSTIATEGNWFARTVYPPGGGSSDNKGRPHNVVCVRLGH
jgi:Protein of unknown function (DUF1566)